MSKALLQPIEGCWDVAPRIKTIWFPSETTMAIELRDGRIIFTPLDRFPSIQRLTVEQRQAWYHFGNGFSFDECAEVIHIEQILGNFEAHRHENEYPHGRD